MISGGKETVLVLWQLDTNLKQFLPHLSAAIESLAVSPKGTLYALRLSDNSVIVLSTAELEPIANIVGLQSYTLSRPTDGQKRLSTTFSKEKSLERSKAEAKGANDKLQEKLKDAETQLAEQKKQRDVEASNAKAANERLETEVRATKEAVAAAQSDRRDDSQAEVAKIRDEIEQLTGNLADVEREKA